MPILLVLDQDQQLPVVLDLLVRTGFVKFAGYLAGSMTAWNNAGLPLQRVKQMHAREVAEGMKHGLRVLDVRQDDEWEKGHVPGAEHCFVGTLKDNPPDIKRTEPVVSYCATGFRASLASSLLQQQGFEDVRSLPGSWQSWKANDLRVEK